jgi:hypothetical protein
MLGKIAKSAGIALIVVAGTTGAISALVASMIFLAYLVGSDLGIFLPPLILMFGVVFAVAWAKT